MFFSENHRDCINPICEQNTELLISEATANAETTEI